MYIFKKSEKFVGEWSWEVNFNAGETHQVICICNDPDTAQMICDALNNPIE